MNGAEAPAASASRPASPNATGDRPRLARVASDTTRDTSAGSLSVSTSEPTNEPAVRTGAEAECSDRGDPQARAHADPGQRRRHERNDGGQHQARTWYVRFRHEQQSSGSRTEAERSEQQSDPAGAPAAIRGEDRQAHVDGTAETQFRGSAEHEQRKQDVVMADVPQAGPDLAQQRFIVRWPIRTDPGHEQGDHAHGSEERGQSERPADSGNRHSEPSQRRPGGGGHTLSRGAHPLHAGDLLGQDQLLRHRTGGGQEQGVHRSEGGRQQEQHGDGGRGEKRG